MSHRSEEARNRRAEDIQRDKKIKAQRLSRDLLPYNFFSDVKYQSPDAPRPEYQK